MSDSILDNDFAAIIDKEIDCPNCHNRIHVPGILSRAQGNAELIKELNRWKHMALNTVRCEDSNCEKCK